MLEEAKSFVKKLYEDDEFMKELFRKGAFIGGKANNPEDAAAQNRKLAEVAPSFGFNFTAEEYESANSEYAKSLGAWKGIKTIFRVMKIGKAVEKEQKRQNK